MPTAANSAFCTTCEWGVFFSAVREGSLPLSETHSLRALHLSLIKHAVALLERVFPSTLFRSEDFAVAG